MTPNAIDFDENLSLLKPYLPAGLYEHFINMSIGKTPLSSQLDQEKMDIVKADGEFLYGQPSPDYCDEQITKFAKKAYRISFVTNRTAEDHYDRAKDFLFDNHNFLIEGMTSDIRPDSQASFIMIFGIGLGHQVEKLLHKYNAKNVILIDRDFETLYHSLHVCDWGQIIRELDKRRGRLHFIFHDDPQIITHLLNGLAKDTDFHLLEGSIVYPHILNEFMLRTVQTFWQSAPNLISYNGWMEDELIHLNNTIANKLRPDHRAISKSSEVTLDKPAFIIGSGPSLDAALPYIKELKEKAYIFSCGTALLPLLKHGIIPDFHCELENGEPALKAIKRAADEFDLSEIPLIASYTCHHSMAQFFRQAFYFNREGNGAPSLLSMDELQIPHVAPSCTNTGTRIAYLMGFRDIYFFGMDFGSVDPGKHHSENVVYKTFDASANFHKDLVASNVGTQKRVAGNFTEFAYTKDVHLFMKAKIELLINIYSDAQYFNCSNGCRILEATPCFPASLADKFQHPKSSSPLELIENVSTPPHPEELIMQLSEQHVVRLLEMMDVLIEKVACKSLSSLEEFLEFIYENTKPLADNDDFHLSSIIGPSFTRLLQFLHHVEIKSAPETGWLETLRHKLVIVCRDLKASIYSILIPSLRHFASDDFLRQVPLSVLLKHCYTHANCEPDVKPDAHIIENYLNILELVAAKQGIEYMERDFNFIERADYAGFENFVNLLDPEIVSTAEFMEFSFVDKMADPAIKPFIDLVRKKYPDDLSNQRINVWHCEAHRNIDTGVIELSQKICARPEAIPHDWYTYSSLLFNIGQLDPAYKITQRFHNELPDNDNFAITYSLYCFLKGSIDEAIRILEEFPKVAEEYFLEIKEVELYKINYLLSIYYSFLQKDEKAKLHHETMLTYNDEEFYKSIFPEPVLFGRENYTEYMRYFYIKPDENEESSKS